jgi:hypothetical protein
MTTPQGSLVAATPDQGRTVSVAAVAAGFGVFPTGEARSVNVGTAKKPCWVIEGPKPSAADVEWARDLVNALHPIPARTPEKGATASPECAQTAGTENRWTSPAESDDREASGESVPAGNFPPNIVHEPHAPKKD